MPDFEGTELSSLLPKTKQIKLRRKGSMPSRSVMFLGLLAEEFSDETTSPKQSNGFGKIEKVSDVAVQVICTTGLQQIAN